MSAIIQAEDQFGVRVPVPGETFVNRTIHPRNLALEARKSGARILSRRELRSALAEMSEIKALLTEAEMPQLKASWMLLRDELAGYRADLDTATKAGDEQAASQALRLIALTVEEQRLVESALAPLMPYMHQLAELKQAVEDHNIASARETMHRKLQQEQAGEAHTFADIIIEKWSQLGYKWEYTEKGKRRVNKISFSEIHVTPDAVWLKVNVSRKGLFGFVSELPNGVKVGDLISPDTLDELSYACQRQVTARKTYTNGVWIKVNRVGTTDGLLEYVTYEQVMQSYPYEAAGFFPIPFGVGEGREISWVHLSKHPHFLIGGSTGGGKSNAINVIIATLISKHAPGDVRLVLVDLKEGLEFKTYEQVPHLLMPVVTEVEEASAVMGQLEAVRRDRAMMLARAGVRDIDQYNAMHPGDKLHRIVVIFDEFAAIKVRKDIEQSIQTSVLQLLNKGRATGLHLVLCTQNPSVDIIPGPSKANMAFRLAGAMPTKAASTTILGVGDAAELPDIPGRMLAMCGAKIWPLQVPHVRVRDIESVLDKAMSYEPAERMEMPEAAVSIIALPDEELIAMMIEEFDGATATRRIFEVVKDTHSVTFSQLSQQMQRLVAVGNVVYKGEQWHFERAKRGYKLVKS